MLIEFECEYQRRGQFELMFPGPDAGWYLPLFPVWRRENYLMAWWARLRPEEPPRKYKTQWSTPWPRPWREGRYANMTEEEWRAHNWTQNVPGNRWNTEEEGVWPTGNEKRDSWLDDGDAFDDLPPISAPTDSEPNQEFNFGDEDGPNIVEDDGEWEADTEDDFDEHVSSQGHGTAQHSHDLHASGSETLDSFNYDTLEDPDADATQRHEREEEEENSLTDDLNNLPPAQLEELHKSPEWAKYQQEMSELEADELDSYEIPHEHAGRPAMGDVDGK